MVWLTITLPVPVVTARSSASLPSTSEWMI
jgi:hypothetical protein